MDINNVDKVEELTRQFNAWKDIIKPLSNEIKNVIKCQVLYDEFKVDKYKHAVFNEIHTTVELDEECNEAIRPILLEIFKRRLQNVEEQLKQL